MLLQRFLFCNFYNTFMTAAAGSSHAPPMVTICIDSGRKNKLRPGEILGALTGEGGITGKVDV